MNSLTDNWVLVSGPQMNDPQINEQNNYSDRANREISIANRARGSGATATTGTQLVATEVATNGLAIISLAQAPTTSYWIANYFMNVSAYRAAEAIIATTAGTIAARALVGTAAFCAVTTIATAALTIQDRISHPELPARPITVARHTIGF